MVLPMRTLRFEEKSMKKAVDDPTGLREWLVTNGLGGYASGTIFGIPTRRYHGLLIAAPSFAARADHDAQQAGRARGHRRRSYDPAFFRVANGRQLRRAFEEPSGRVPPGSRTAGLALRDRLDLHRKATPYDTYPKYRSYPLPTVRWICKRLADATSSGPLPTARRLGQSAAFRSLSLHGLGQTLRTDLGRRKSHAPNELARARRHVRSRCRQFISDPLPD